MGRHHPGLIRYLGHLTVWAHLATVLESGVSASGRRLFWIWLCERDSSPVSLLEVVGLLRSDYCRVVVAHCRHHLLDLLMNLVEDADQDVLLLCQICIIGAFKLYFGDYEHRSGKLLHHF